MRGRVRVGVGVRVRVRVWVRALRAPWLRSPCSAATEKPFEVSHLPRALACFLKTQKTITWLGVGVGVGAGLGSRSRLGLGLAS